MTTINSILQFDESKPLSEQSTDFQEWYAVVSEFPDPTLQYDVMVGTASATVGIEVLLQALNPRQDEKPI